MKYTFSRRTMLERYLGPKFKFESVEFGVEADTKEEAEKEAEKWKNEFMKKAKAKLIKPVKRTEETPFEGNEYAKK